MCECRWYEVVSSLIRIFALKKDNEMLQFAIQNYTILITLRKFTYVYFKSIFAKSNAVLK